MLIFQFEKNSTPLPTTVPGLVGHEVFRDTRLNKDSSITLERIRDLSTPIDRYGILLYFVRFASVQKRHRLRHS